MLLIEGTVTNILGTFSRHFQGSMVCGRVLIFFPGTEQLSRHRRFSWLLPCPGSYAVALALITSNMMDNIVYYLSRECHFRAGISS